MNSKWNGAEQASANRHYLYVGGWAGAKGSAAGIQAFVYNTHIHSLSYIDTFGSYKSMSNVAVNGDLLFTCVESKDDDLILTYRIQTDGSLVPLDSARAEGFGIADLTLDPKGRYLFTCNFKSCSLSMLRYDADGKLTLTDRYQVTDPGSYEIGFSSTERQNSAYTHCAHVMPDGEHLCLCDMGSDKLYIFALDRINGKLIPCPELTVTIDGGEGARHIIFSADGRLAYMNTEMGNTVYVFSVGMDSSLTRLQKVSTLEPGVENPPKGWCSVTAMSPDGRYLYTGNRGQNNVAGFKIGEDGLLSGIGFFDCYGDSPRCLTFGFNGEVLFCSCNISETLSVIACDKETGRLGECIQRINSVPGAAGIAWCAAGAGV